MKRIKPGVTHQSHRTLLNLLCLAGETVSISDIPQTTNEIMPRTQVHAYVTVDTRTRGEVGSWIQDGRQ